jgi:CTP:molybdopterin cytidylyltransferase MocA
MARTIEDRRCIGILLERCRMPEIACNRCWFADNEGHPTLVNIEVFNRCTRSAA